MAYDSNAGILSFVIYFTKMFGFGNPSGRITCKAPKKSEAKLGFTAFKAALVNERKKSAPNFSFHIFLYFFPPGQRFIISFKLSIKLTKDGGCVWFCDAVLSIYYFTLSGRKMA